MRRARDRARCATQTAEERDARLRQIRDNRRQITGDSTCQCERLAAETTEIDARFYSE